MVFLTDNNPYTDWDQEGKSGIIELKAIKDDAVDQDDVCDDPEIVKLMIEYFYHFDYTEGCGSALGSCGKLNKEKQTVVPSKRVREQTPSVDNDNDDEDTAASVADATPAPISSVHSATMVEHAKLFAMAVNYQVDGLRDLAVSKFSEAVKAGWDHEDFAHTVFLVYNTTADDIIELRDVVADTLYEHFGTLKNKDEVATVVRSIPGLGYDLFKRSYTSRMVCSHNTYRQERACQSCCQIFQYCSSCYNPSYGAYSSYFKCPNCHNVP